jgi:hypothetical protein
MRPVPASKYSDIINDLNQIDSEIDYKPYIFRLNTYKQETKKMIQKNPEEAYIILGIIACIENDLELMHKYHLNAISSSGQSLLSLYQYCCSLSEQDFYQDAKKYALKAHEKVPEDRALSFILYEHEDYILYKKKLEKLGFEFQDPNDFIEDEEVSLKEAIISVDGILNKNPQMIFESDPDLEALVDELIEGVDIA